MAFDGIIDAITGPSFKMPDGSSKTSTLSEYADVLKDEAVSTAERVIEHAEISIKSTIIPTIGKIANKVLPSALAASASLQYMGSQGSFVDFLQPAYLQTSCFHIEADKHVYIGWPCHKTLILGSLSGFTLCENAQVEIYGATVEELEIIKQFLESGVYIE